MGKSLGRESNFEARMFEPGYGILVKKTSFGYQEGVLFQRRGPMTEKALYCQVMIEHMEWKEQVNQKIL